MPIATHSMDESMERPISRFVIGIDLGTTNCAVAYVDTLHATPTVETFRIEQLVDWSSVESRDTLPSFHYQLTDQEANSVQNRWIDRGTNSAATQSSSVQPSIVGALARDRGLEIPGRQISSAKSWLCHSGVDRTAAFLPWHGDEGVELLSPVEASASYLRYLRLAWDRAFSAHPMADQDVVVTLPASFDEVARELTVEAAKLAGLPRIVLLEEPQAAFYAWLCRHGEDWTSKIAAGKTILVCDIGGGTTDFTLIRVKSEALASETPDANSTNNLSTTETTQRLHRVAVGEHLILGGDNLDLALARAAELKLVGNDQSRLPSREWDSLRQHCRVAKELLLGSSAPQQHIITLVGSGSRLLSQTKTVTIDQEMIQKVLLDGFFPLISIDEQPSQAASGFQEFGLPYASDPAITKHLAAFLWSHRFAGRDSDECQKLGDLQAARPDVILFNGGVLESSQIRERILEQIRHWFASTIDPQWKVEELKGNRLDLAVAQGAAYFGQVRRGIGVRIDASLARSYYMQVAASPPKAICLVPGDAVAGDRFRLDQHPFSLTLGEPVQFPLWYSSIRLADQVGEIVYIDDQQMKPLPIIQTVLELKRSRKSDQVPVFIDAELTEIGTLQLACALQDGEHRWKLDFDVRSTIETDRIAHQGQGEQLGIVDEQAIETAQSVIASVFGESATVDPKDLAKRLSERLEIPKNSWPPSLLRAIWASLIEYDESRSKSPSHESRWLNLLGFCLRPGYGFAADDWRVATSWRRVQGKLKHRGASSTSEAVILWRRIAGGFTAGQQKALYQDLLPRLRSILANDSKSSLSVPTNEAIELLRLAGSLELLPAVDKAWLAKSGLAALKRKKFAPMAAATLWMIGRVGARRPAYGPLHTLVPQSQAEAWIEQLLPEPLPVSEKAFCLMLLARKTGDRYRDISEKCREQVLRWLQMENVSESTIRLVQAASELSEEQRAQVLGDTLPLGLRIR